MPMRKELYPDNWKALAHSIKSETHWCCEKCGKPCRRPDETWTDFYSRLPKKWHQDWVNPHEKNATPKRGRFVLTVAHLDHVPWNCDRANLRAWCAPCHARYDLSQIELKRMLARERQGQMRIPGL